jgi:membrane associated rhomboid family serine protease
MNKSIDVIKVLILVNVVFAGITFLVPGMKNQMFYSLALFFPENEHFRYWQFVTSMFMHGGFIHLLLNMYALWAFGTPLEKMWGKNKFLFFYFLSGIGANLIYVGVNYFQFHSIYNELLNAGLSADVIQVFFETYPIDTSITTDLSKERLTEFWNIFHGHAVGASGAIYGILVAFGMAYPNAKLALIFLPVPIAAKYFIPVLIAIDLFSGVTGFSIFGGNIGHFAHVGGALVGFILVLLWGRNTLKTQVYEDDGY